jgi:GTP-binding protein YchF
MGLKAGIIGLPNVGKSTIFNALTKSAIPAENYPFCTIDPNVGIVEVPDNRLNILADIFNPKLITPAIVEFVDIAGLVRGASKGEGLGNQFLSHIRDVNTIIHVVRSFEEDNITHVDGTLNPIRDIETIETELLLRDIASVEKRIEKLQKTVRIGDKNSKEEMDVLDFIYPKMNEGILVHDILLNSNQKNYLHVLSLLTNKPTLYVINTDEDEINSHERSPDIQQLFDFAEKRGNCAIRLCGKLEAEISTLDEEEKLFYLEEYNLKDPGLNKLIHISYSLLDLETFFTAGEKEVRAWTIINGMSAPEAAGEIHTDMKRGFIKAEVYAFDDLMKYKSESALKDAGKIRQEGKNYIIRDGDVIFFKFNV